MSFTDDPVRDAERYFSEAEEEQNEREYIVCDICGEKIFCGDGYWEGDTYYIINELNICEDCISNYIRTECQTTA